MRNSYERLSDRIKNSMDGKALLREIRFYEGQVAVGDTIKPFKLHDNHNNAFEYKKTPGQRLILLDFWASWCAPCIEEIPVMEKAYARYKDQGFDIIGISVDKDPARWLQALSGFKYPWTQLIDKDGAPESLRGRFNIGAIPFNILVDENLKIIAVNLRKEALLDKLQDLLGR